MKIFKLIAPLLLLAGFASADTGFRDMIQITETDGSPKCMAGQLKFQPTEVSCSGNVATIDTVGGAGGAGSANYSKSFTAATSVALEHNASTTSIIVQCFDDAATPQYIEWDTLKIITSTSATVTFSSAKSGTCIVNTSGGSSSSSGGSSSLAVTIGVVRSSPTSDEMFNPSQFSGAISGSTITVSLNSSSVTLGGPMINVPSAVLYNNAGAIGGSKGFQFNGSSVSVALDFGLFDPVFSTQTVTLSQTLNPTNRPLTRGYVKAVQYEGQTGYYEFGISTSSTPGATATGDGYTYFNLYPPYTEGGAEPVVILGARRPGLGESGKQGVLRVEPSSVTFRAFSLEMGKIAKDSETDSARLILYAGNGSNFVSLKASGTISSDVAFKLPSADGTSGQVLHTNGGGDLYFDTDDSSAGGGDNLGSHVATMTVTANYGFVGSTVTVSSNTVLPGTTFYQNGIVAGITLSEIENPTADKTFTMANKQLKFSYTAPATSDGAFEIEGIGGFSGDLLHLHQHTGNPGAGTDLLHIEADDVDVVPLRIIGAGATTAEISGPGIVRISSNTVLAGTTFYHQASPAFTISPTLSDLSASQLVVTDAAKKLVSQSQITDAQIADSAVDGGAGGEIADGSIVGADVDTSSFTMLGPTLGTSELPTNSIIGKLGNSWDGGGSALTAGTTYWLSIPSSGTINSFTFTASPAGTLDVYVSTSVVFNTGITKICASACPTLSAASYQKDTSLTGWSTALARDGFLYFVINAAATSTQAQVTLEYTKN